MRKRIIFATIASALVASRAYALEPPNQAVLHACDVLQRNELSQVIGTEVKDTKTLEKKEGGFFISQCRFILREPGEIIDLRIVQSDSGENARDPRAAWNEAFTPENREKETRGREKEEAEKTEPVEKVGEEAYWRGKKKLGSLYVLKGNRYFQVTANGRAGEKSLRKRCAAVAKLVLKHL